MTMGGKGVMMWFPLSEERSFFRFRPIPVSPISVRAFFSEWGLRVMRVEIWFILGALCVGVGVNRALGYRRGAPATS